MSPLFTLNVHHRSIRNFLICIPVQCNANRKTGWAVVPDDLNAADGLAARPLLDGLQVLFSEIPVAHSDRFKLRHADSSNKEGPPQPGRCDGPKVFRSNTKSLKP